MRILLLTLLVLVTGCSKEWFDMAQPSVISVSPVNGAQGVALRPVIYVDFSKEMDTLQTEKSFSFSCKNSSPTGSFRWSGNRLYFDLNEDLVNGIKYTITILSKAEDKAGNNIAATFTSTFIPGVDIIQPSVVSFSAERIIGAVTTNIPITAGMNGIFKNDTIIIEFSEPISIESALENITISPSVLVQKDVSGVTLRLVPYEGLVNGTKYTVSVKNGIKDLAGNTLASEKSISFFCGTDFVKPAISSVTEITSNTPLQPFTLNNGIVEKNSGIRIRFSEAMDRQSVLDAISISPSVDYNFIWAADNTYADISLKSSVLYQLDKIYTITINNSAKDISENTLSQQYDYSFKINGPNSRPISVSSVYQMQVDGSGNVLGNLRDISLPYSALDMSSPGSSYDITTVMPAVTVYVIRVNFQSTSLDNTQRRIDFISASESISFTNDGYHGTLTEQIPSIYKIVVSNTYPYYADIHLYKLGPDYYYRLKITGGSTGIKDYSSVDSSIPGNYMLQDYNLIIQ